MVRKLWTGWWSREGRFICNDSFRPWSPRSLHVHQNQYSFTVFNSGNTRLASKIAVLSLLALSSCYRKLRSIRTRKCPRIPDIVLKLRILLGAITRRVSFATYQKYVLTPHASCFSPNPKSCNLSFIDDHNTSRTIIRIKSAFHIPMLICYGRVVTCVSLLLWNVARDGKLPPRHVLIVWCQQHHDVHVK